MQEAYPADTVSLRSVTSDNFVIIDTSSRREGDADGQPEVIGEVDFSSALTTVHPKAIYLHQGQQYHVERLDFDQRKAYVKPVNVDYYTDAIRYTQVRVLEIADEERIAGPAARAHGDVLVRSQVVGFKKIKFFTNENVGDGKLELPENEMHTTAFWITLERPLLAGLPFALSERQSGIFGLLLRAGIHGDAAADVRPARSGHGGRRTAAEPRRRNRVAGIYDGHRAIRQQMKEFFEPNLYLYDAYPGGIGFSEPLYRVHDLLLAPHARADCGVPVRKRMPFVRRARRREERAHKGSGARDSGSSLRIKRTACTAETQRTLRNPKILTTEVTEEENMRTQRRTT